MRAPFEILYAIIAFDSVLVIHTTVIVGVLQESHSNYSVDRFPMSTTKTAVSVSKGVRKGLEHLAFNPLPAATTAICLSV